MTEADIVLLLKMNREVVHTWRGGGGLSKDEVVEVAHRARSFVISILVYGIHCKQLFEA